MWLLFYIDNFQTYIKNIYISKISCETAVRWTPHDLTDGQSTLVQVMACCRPATGYMILHEQKLTQIYATMWRHLTMISWFVNDNREMLLWPHMMPLGHNELNNRVIITVFSEWKKIRGGNPNGQAPLNMHNIGI